MICVYWGYCIRRFYCIYQRQISIQLHHHDNFMHYFTIFILLRQTLCCHYYCTQQAFDFIAQIKKNIDNIIDYNTGKHWWLCQTIHMCLCTIIYVSYASMLNNYNWSRHNCNWSWQRSCRCNQWCWVALYISIDVQCSTTWIKQI